MTVRVRLALVAVAAVLGAGAAIARGQQPGPAQTRPPVFRDQTNIVSVDVRVVDAQGRPVTDLTDKDFTVTEDGRSQEIVAFATQAFSTGTSERPASLRRRTSSMGALSGQNQRIFLLVLGRGSMAACVLNDGTSCSFTDGIRKGLDGLVHFVREAINPQDYVAVLGYNRLTDFTTDHAKVLDVIERYRTLNKQIETDLVFVETGLAGLYGNREPHPKTQALIDRVFAETDGFAVRRLAPVASPMMRTALAHQNEIFDDLERAAAPSGDPFADLRVRLRTQSRPGSPALPGRDSGGRGGRASGDPVDDDVTSFLVRGLKDTSSLYAGVDALRALDGEKHLVFMSPGGAMHDGDVTRHVAQVASDARVVIDVIHTGGVSDTSRGLVAGSRELAITTGGQFDASRFPTAAMDLDRIAAGTSFQYLLGYRLPQESGEPRFRQIRVSVNRPGLTVMYRRGYFSPADRSGEMTRRTLQYARIGAAAEYVREIPDLAF